MTWDAHHRRDDVLRTVVDEVNARRDGSVPMELPGVAETFRGRLDLVAALQLRWHTRLAGNIERELMDRPADLEGAVLTAWQTTVDDLPGVRAVLDASAADPTEPGVAAALERAHRKEWALLAAMAGRASAQDAAAARVGQALEERARASYVPTPVTTSPRHRQEPQENDERPGLIGRIRAVLAA
ncbi:MAG: hypothetical protein ACXVW6_02995 [Nocardioidaceae bacterium]